MIEIIVNIAAVFAWSLMGMGIVILLGLWVLEWILPPIPIRRKKCDR